MKNKRYMRKSMTFVLALAMVLSLLVGLQIPVFADAETTINILHTNDVHGRFYQIDDSITGMIGIDKVAAIKNDTPNAILVDVGDVIHGTRLVNINQGLNAIELMVAAGYSVMTPGNHDFNFGSKRLLELAEIASKGGLEIITANVFEKETGEIFLPAATIIEMDGIKVGFFGLTTTSTPTVTHPANVETLVFAEYLDYAANAIGDLRDNGAQIIVAMAHVEYGSIDSLLGSLNDKPDVVLEGHDHLLGARTVEGVLIAGAGEHQTNLGVVSVTISSNGVITEKKAELISKEDTEDIERDEEVKAKAEAMKVEVEGVYDVVVASSEVLLSSVRGNDEGLAGVRNTEQPLGNLVADAMRIISEADVAVTNGGGLRADIRVGDLTKGDIYDVLPFGNYIVVKEVTPAELYEIIEIGLQSLPLNNGRFPQISGMSVEFIMSRAEFDRVVSIKLGDAELDPEDDTTVYSLATNNFIAAGGDAYTIMEGLATVTELGSLDDMLIEYITEVLDGTITAGDAKIEGRVIELPSAWAVREVADAVDAGLVPQNLQWRYNQPTTRAEFAQLAVVMYEKIAGVGIVVGDVSFDDTDDEYVLKAASVGVVEGYGDGTFGPGNTLTREQAAAMLVRLAVALETPLPDAEATFADVGSVSAWALQAVGAVQAAGVMEGVGENTFSPRGQYVRQQSIATILRLFNELSEQGGAGEGELPVAA